MYSFVKFVIGCAVVQVALAQLPTSMPSAAPSAAITDIPVGDSVVVFPVSLGYDGIDASTWNANKATNDATACAATTNTLNLPKSACTVTGVVDKSRRRLFQGVTLLTTPSVTVTTDLSAPGSNANVATTYVSTLNTAISSGAFQQSVQQAATTQGATTLQSVSIPTTETATTSGGTVTTATAAPTSSPTSAPKSSSSSNNAASSPGAIVGYVLGGLVLIAICVYIFAPNVFGLPSRGDAYAESESEFSTSKSAPKAKEPEFQNML